jgi:hypothetical protein
MHEQKLGSTLRFPFFILLMYSLGASLAAVTLGCCQGFPAVHWTCWFSSSSAGCTVPLDRLLHSSLSALDGYRRRHSMPFSASAPSAAASNCGVVLGDPMVKFHVRSTYKATLSPHMEELWNAVLPLMKRDPGSKYSPVNKPRNADLFTLPWCDAMVTHSSLEAIAAVITQVRVRRPFLRLQN